MPCFKTFGERVLETTKPSPCQNGPKANGLAVWLKFRDSSSSNKKKFPFCCHCPRIKDRGILLRLPLTITGHHTHGILPGINPHRKLVVVRHATLLRWAVFSCSGLPVLGVVGPPDCDSWYLPRPDKQSQCRYNDLGCWHQEVFQLLSLDDKSRVLQGELSLPVLYVSTQTLSLTKACSILKMGLLRLRSQARPVTFNIMMSCRQWPVRVIPLAHQISPVSSDW